MGILNRRHLHRGILAGLLPYCASAVAQATSGAYFVGSGPGMYSHISDAEAAIGKDNMGSVILTAGYTDTINSTLNIGWNNGYGPAKGIKLIMMPGSTVAENITDGGPGIVVFDGSSVECLGATASGDMNGNPSTCQITTDGPAVKMSAMIASSEIVTGNFQNTFGMQGITLNPGSATVTAEADLGGFGGPSTIINNILYGGPNVTYLVHLHNNVGGGVEFANNQLRGANAVTGAELYITGGESTGYQGVTGGMDITGGEISCTGPNAPAIKIDGDPNNTGREGIIGLNIHGVWTQTCLGTTGIPPTYITIHNASFIHIYDQVISTPSANFISISESAPGLSNMETFDNVEIVCSSQNCNGQTFIVDSTTGGYTHPATSQTVNIPLYGYVGHIQHDEAGEWTAGRTASAFNGQVGIGTADPKGMLDVRGGYDASAPSTSSAPVIRANGGGALSLWMSDYAYYGSWIQSIQDDGTNLVKDLFLEPLGGDIGIGTTAPRGRLDVRGLYDPNVPAISSTPVIRANGGGALSLWMSNYSYFGSWIQSIQDDGTNRLKSLYLEPLGGYVGVGTTSPQAELDVNGSIRVSGSKGVIQFPDGTVQTTAFIPANCGADFAESVDVTGGPANYSAGDVLVVDPEIPGNFLKSDRPYSTLVAGVYSTKPSFVGRLNAPDAGTKAREIPMAMLGRVPTKVSTENGPIHIGDLLVTASTPGYAMKGTDRTRMLGTVIGKALGTLDSGKGVILVLVSLQ